MVEVAWTSRDELEESDGLVAPVTSYFPGEWDEGAALGADRRAVLGVLRIRVFGTKKVSCKI